jgi:hypothetical protein
VRALRKVPLLLSSNMETLFRKRIGHGQIRYPISVKVPNRD